MSVEINPRTFKEEGQMAPPIGFLDLNFEAFKQSKWNLQYL